MSRSVFGTLELAHAHTVHTVSEADRLSNQAHLSRAEYACGVVAVSAFVGQVRKLPVHRALEHENASSAGPHSVGVLTCTSCCDRLIRLNSVTLYEVDLQTA